MENRKIISSLNILLPLGYVLCYLALRFSNQELTMTQSFLEMVRRHPLYTIVLLLIYFVPKCFK